MKKQAYKKPTLNKGPVLTTITASVPKVGGQKVV
jgi:hypothetical protein